MGIADDLKDTSGRLRIWSRTNEGRVDDIFARLEEAVPEARDAFATIKRFGEQAETGKGMLPALLNDEQMYQDLKNSWPSLSTALDRTDQIGEGHRRARAPRQVHDRREDGGGLRPDPCQPARRRGAPRKGDNTLARLTRDDDLYKQAKGVLDDARESLRGLKEQVPLGTFASVLLSAF